MVYANPIIGVPEPAPAPWDLNHLPYNLDYGPGNDNTKRDRNERFNWHRNDQLRRAETFEKHIRNEAKLVVSNVRKEDPAVLAECQEENASSLRTQQLVRRPSGRFSKANIALRNPEYASSLIRQDSEAVIKISTTASPAVDQSAPATLPPSSSPLVAKPDANPLTRSWTLPASKAEPATTPEELQRARAALHSSRRPAQKPIVRTPLPAPSPAAARLQRWLSPTPPEATSEDHATTHHRGLAPDLSDND